MNNLRRVIVALAVGAVIMSFVASCSVATPAALTVGTYSLSRKDFLDELDQLTKAGILPPVTNPNASQTTDTAPVAYSPSSASQVLNAHAQYQLIHQLVLSKGLQTTPDDEKIGLALLGQRIGSSSQTGQTPTADQVTSTLARYGPLGDVLKGQATDSATLERALVPDDEVRAQGQKAYEQQKESLSQTCVQLLVVTAGAAPTSQAEASQQPSDAEYAAALAKVQGAKAKIDGGQSIADVAKTDSSQPDSATEQCVTATQIQGAPQELVTAINTTAAGKVSDPIKVTDLPGYVLVGVSGKKTPTYDDAKAQIEPTVRSQIGAQRVNDAVEGSVGSVKVTVDPLFGNWDEKNHAVVAPVGAAEPSVPTTADSLLNPASPTSTTTPRDCTPATVTPPPADQKPKVEVAAGAPPTALEVKTLTEGDGPAVQAGDQISIQYVGALAKDGTEFDSSWSRDAKPLDFTVGQSEVIPGMDQGVVGLKLGSRAQITIPADLAYGAKGQGSIGPNEALVFVVDIVQICTPSAGGATGAGAAGADATGSTSPSAATGPGSSPSTTTPAPASSSTEPSVPTSRAG